MSLIEQEEDLDYEEDCDSEGHLLRKLDRDENDKAILEMF
jgi:hypothetical protein